MFSDFIHGSLDNREGFDDINWAGKEKEILKTWL